jgi:hypothetical protein
MLAGRAVDDVQWRATGSSACAVQVESEDNIFSRWLSVVVSQ